MESILAIIEGSKLFARDAKKTDTRITAAILPVEILIVIDLA